MLQSLESGGNAVFQVAVPWRSPLVQPLFLPSVLRSVRRVRPDVLLVDSIALSCIAFGSILIRQGDPAVVALMHQLPSAALEQDARWQQAGRLSGGRTGVSAARPGVLVRRAIERRVLRRADLIVSVSHDLACQIVRLGIAPERVEVVSPGRDGARAPVVATGSRAGGGSTRFLCVANWLPGKGIGLLVEAFARMTCQRATLELVGDREVDRGYTEQVEALIVARGLHNRTVIAGPVPWEVLAPHYARADVFVLPSLHEGYGTVYAEALSAGLPIVGNRLEPLTALVEDGVEGMLVEPGDLDGLAVALDCLALDPALRLRMSQSAIARASRLPTWNQSGARLEELLRGLTDMSAS